MTQPPTKRLATESFVNTTIAAAISSALAGVVNPGAVNEGAPLTTTNLTASATYTQPTQDLGVTVASRATAVNVLVRHLAGTNPGLLIVQESTDASSWRETFRVPVPSDGLYHSFSQPLHHRYFRLVFTNGATTQTGFWLSYVATLGEGESHNEATLLFPHAVGVALTGSATLTGATLDLGGSNDWDRVRTLVASNQTGTINVQQSLNGSTWFTTATAAIAVNVTQVIDAIISAQYVRFTFVNGATAITSGGLTISQTLVAAA
jgi:hypothetical protein